MLNESMEQFIREHKEEAFELLRTIGRIPAPSNHEEKRAAFCCQWLKEQGAEGVIIDEALNVVYPAVTRETAGLEVYMAHMDVVFPDKEDLPLTENGDFIFCPGIGDDTACLVCLLMAAKYLARAIKEDRLEEVYPSHLPGLLLVCNSGEEGLGNLKGVRKICEKYGNQISAFCTFDSQLDKLVDQAVGSERFRITVRTQGGHSFNDFGRDNAIEKLAEVISLLYRIPVPENGRTTFNVGQIQGGTSVNTIAQEAHMLYEFRSDRKENLDIYAQTVRCCDRGSQSGWHRDSDGASGTSALLWKDRSWPSGGTSWAGGGCGGGSHWDASPDRFGFHGLQYSHVPWNPQRMRRMLSGRGRSYKRGVYRGLFAD